jgi:hypothetical protein
MSYHVEINSIYIKLVRLRYKGDGFGKYWVNYYLKTNDELIATDRNLRINDETINHWHLWQRDK